MVPTAARQYTTNISRELRFLATWPAGMPIGLGTIGVIDPENVFQPISDLDVHNVDYESVEDATPDDVMSYASGQSVRFELGVSGSTPDLGPIGQGFKATAKISFGDEHALVFRAEQLRHRRVRDEPALARAVLDLAESAAWERNWLVVTHVVEAGAATVLISNSRNASVELGLKADVNVAGIEVVGAELSPKVVSHAGMHTVMVASSGVVPLFRAKRLKRRFWTDRPYLAGYSDEIRGVDRDRDDLDEEILEEIVVYDAL